MVLLQQPRWIKIPVTSVNGQGSPFTWLAEDVDWIPYWCPQFPRDRPTWLLWGFRLHHRDTAGVGVEGKVKTGHIGKPHRKKRNLTSWILEKGLQWVSSNQFKPDCEPLWGLEEGTHFNLSLLRLPGQREDMCFCSCWRAEARNRGQLQNNSAFHLAAPTASSKESGPRA